MKRLLILLALSSLGAAACSEDTTDNKPAAPQADASTSTPAPVIDSGVAAPMSRGVQITNLAAACVDNSNCKGAGKVSCIHDLGMLGGTIPGGYCTADCQVDAECGPGGACPIASVGRSPDVAALLQGFRISLSQFLPVQCYATCTKTAAKACVRDDQTCASIIEVMGSQGSSGGGGAIDIAGLLAQFPESKQTFCFPPVEMPGRDAGPASSGDAGAPVIVRGMDSGI